MQKQKRKPKNVLSIKEVQALHEKALQAEMEDALKAKSLAGEGQSHAA